MTETRWNRSKSGEEFVGEALRMIKSVREDGAVTPEEIAEALNRSGFPDERGRQWNASKVMAFLGTDDAVRALRKQE